MNDDMQSRLYKSVHLPEALRKHGDHDQADHAGGRGGGGGEPEKVGVGERVARWFSGGKDKEARAADRETRREGKRLSGEFSDEVMSQMRQKMGPDKFERYMAGFAFADFEGENDAAQAAAAKWEKERPEDFSRLKAWNERKAEKAADEPETIQEIIEGSVRKRAPGSLPRDFTGRWTPRDARSAPVSHLHDGAVGHTHRASLGGGAPPAPAPDGGGADG